jgi:thiamine biosynthesis lipoprotein
MGTTISIDIVDSHDRTIIDELVAWFHQVDEVFSPYKEHSPISRIGRGELAPTDPVVGDDVREVLQRCGELAEETDGVFDVWSLPSPNGTRFDPCGYVKGWSVQRAARLLHDHGVIDFCLNAGGDVVLGGRNGNGTRNGNGNGDGNGDGADWRVGIRHPDDPMAIALILHGSGPLAIATSGTYERGAHIVDPRSGLPITELASATVVGPDLADADAYATTLYVMGVDGLYWLAEHRGYSGCVITRDGRVISTDSFNAYRTS